MEKRTNLFEAAALVPNDKFSNGSGANYLVQLFLPLLTLYLADLHQWLETVVGSPQLEILLLMPPSPHASVRDMNSYPIVIAVPIVFASFAFLPLKHEPSHLRTHGVCLNHTFLSCFSTRSALDPNRACHHRRIEIVTIVFHLYRNSCPTWGHTVDIDFVVADSIQDEIWEWVAHKYFAVVFTSPVFTPEAESRDPAVVERRAAPL